MPAKKKSKTNIKSVHKYHKNIYITVDILCLMCRSLHHLHQTQYIPDACPHILSHCKFLICTKLALTVCPRLSHTILNNAVVNWYLCRSTKSRRYIFCQITEPCIQPVAWTAFIGKPAMYGKYHLIWLRIII